MPRSRPRRLAVETVSSARAKISFLPMEQREQAHELDTAIEDLADEPPTVIAEPIYRLGPNGVAAVLAWKPLARALRVKPDENARSEFYVIAGEHLGLEIFRKRLDRGTPVREEEVVALRGSAFLLRHGRDLLDDATAIDQRMVLLSRTRHMKPARLHYLGVYEAAARCAPRESTPLPARMLGVIFPELRARRRRR